MKISQNWLKKYIDFKLTPEQLTEELSMLGLEVESYEDLSKKFNNFVVGEVLERAKHPNADRLSVCKVNIGSEVKEIVCGAPNVAAGQKVAVALLGAVIVGNAHNADAKPFKIERAKIRGVESCGMICSEVELGIGEDASGILVLDNTVKPGTPLAKYLNQTDTVYEIGITPNRSDCLSHIGVAREVAVVVGKKIKLPKIVLKESKELASKNALIEILDKEKCPRYTARVMRNIKIAPSPKWLQDLLTSVGVRPINNVVDVTNYVLMEIGHPLHAFDYDKLVGKKIVVKSASQNEKFITLDGKERILASDTLMICDGEKPIALAGIMGGANSEISDTTQNILIESAYFNPQNIRRTSKRLGLSTEASYRFERGADINITDYAVNRAAQLIQEIAGGDLLKGVIDIYPKKQNPLSIKARISKINSTIGINLKKSQIVSLLKKIELHVKPTSSANEIIVSVPTYRNDIIEEIDIIEEVVRVYGYNNIETKTRAAIDFSSNVRTDLLQAEIRNYLVGAGFNEILAISLQDEKTLSIDGTSLVKAINPVSAEMSTLRSSLIPTALKIVKHNLNHGAKELRLFEIGSVFSKNKSIHENSLDAYLEEERLLILLCGNNTTISYGNNVRKTDVLDIKGEINTLLTKFCLDNYSFIYYDIQNALCDIYSIISIKNTHSGFFGKIKKSILQKFEIEEDVFVCELNLASIKSGFVKDKKFTHLPKFPSVTRDLAFTVDSSLHQKKVQDVICEYGKPLCVDVTLFDVYIGAQTGNNKKSLAYTLKFQSLEHTLTEKEIDVVVDKIVTAVSQKCGASLRV